MGASMRLEGTPHFPKNAALGCIEDNQLIYEYGREVAREFRELGVHVNFAPDADVNTNPLNPVIHVRSFGEDPKKVAEKVLAYSRGLESGGVVLSVSKHFPGQRRYGRGSRIRDCRCSTIIVNVWIASKLYPFREMVRAGLGGGDGRSFASACLEPDAETASSLSRNVVTGLLKDEMGFRAWCLRMRWI
ncbi:MAG: glycoside hydrolase family 3 N-terminal domain-containing protein [Bacteroides cellulosilyticus]